MATSFSDYFGVRHDVVEEYGAFDVSIINDLPLFIDPFLLFNSDKKEYRDLHDGIIKYLIFLRDKAASGSASDDLLRFWYCFPEVRQNWLGFSLSGNGGSGLGIDFARALHSNLNQLFSDFGSERITAGSHLEKVCLIREGIGRDNISDFTTNLIISFICEYTQTFAHEHIEAAKLKRVSVKKTRFNYDSESWERAQYDLPWMNGDYVILTPKDMLTRDENWINRGDLIRSFDQLPSAIPDSQLRAQISNYFVKVLVKHPDREANRKERDDAAKDTILHFPKMLDYYIKLKEDKGNEAVDVSSGKVSSTETVYVKQLRELQSLLEANTQFYKTAHTTYCESHARLAYLKDVIETKADTEYSIKVTHQSDLRRTFRFCSAWFGMARSLMLGRKQTMGADR